MAREIKKEGSAFGAVASIAIPLVQLFAVSSVALSNQLKLTSFFVNGDFLPAINVFIIFITLSIIGLMSVRQGNIFFRKNKNNLLINEKEHQINFLSSLVWYLQMPSFILFIFSILFVIKSNTNLSSFLQYLFYSIFLVISGIILFFWVQEYIRKNNQPRQEDFVPNLLDSLRRHKLLKENPVEVLDQVGLENGRKLVRVKIETQTEYFLITDFFGFNIEKTWDIKNVPEVVKNFLDNYNNFK